MTSFTLGINTGFATNRFPEPEEWARIVAEELELTSVQLVAALLNPFWPESVIEAEVERILQATDRYQVNIHSLMTSTFTRLNHFMYPHPELRHAWKDWLGDSPNSPLGWGRAPWAAILALCPFATSTILCAIGDGSMTQSGIGKSFPITRAMLDSTMSSLRPCPSPERWPIPSRGRGSSCAESTRMLACPYACAWIQVTRRTLMSGTHIRG